MATGSQREVRMQTCHMGCDVDKIAPLYDTRATLVRSLLWDLDLGLLRDSRWEIRGEKMLNLVCAAVAFISEANRCD